MAQITINGISIDPIRQASALVVANAISPDASGSNFILVQARGRLDQAQISQLKGLGAEILEYV